MTKSSPKTSLKQKVGLIAFGFIVSCVALEIALRLTGAVFLHLQERRNQAMQGTDDVYTILCLGESTTALGDDDSYPSQLQEILNQSNAKRKYRVINKGVPSITSEYIYEHLEANLKKYQPDMVVTMMGINDHITNQTLDRGLVDQVADFIAQFRVVQFVTAAIPYFRGRVDEEREQGAIDADELMDRGIVTDQQDAPTQMLRQIGQMEQATRAMDELIEQSGHPSASPKALEALKQRKGVGAAQMKLLVYVGRWYTGRGDVNTALGYFRQAVEADPQSVVAYLELARALRRLKQFGPALTVLQQAAAIDQKVPMIYLEMARLYRDGGQAVRSRNMYQFIVDNRIGDHWMYLEAGDVLSKLKDYALAQKAYDLAIEKDPRSSNSYDHLGELFFQQGLLARAEQTYRDGFEYNGHRANMYQGLIRALKSQAKNDEVPELTKQAEYYQNEYVHPYTLHYYRRIAALLKDKGVRHVSMQYPMLDQQSIRHQLSDFDDLVFVENLANFEDELADLEYSELFSDHFAGDFGHCSVRCNRLIAEQLAAGIQHALPAGSE